jgi:hypothetical protein
MIGGKLIAAEDQKGKRRGSPVLSVMRPLLTIWGLQHALSARSGNITLSAEWHDLTVPPLQAKDTLRSFMSRTRDLPAAISLC